ncbi:DUF3168 domain-containing protein [Planococcus sp. SIMBA_143]
MAIPSFELQKSIYNKLNTDYEVFESKPVNQPFPYILIGEDIITDYKTKDKKRTRHTITIHTFTKDKSSLNSKTMNHFVKESIEEGFTADGFSVGLINLEMMMTQKEELTDGNIYHGILEFEIDMTEKL